jgi:hypothetical protein
MNFTSSSRRDPFMTVSKIPCPFRSLYLPGNAGPKELKSRNDPQGTGDRCEILY